MESFLVANLFGNKFWTNVTKHFRYLKWRNPHLYKLYGYGLCKGKPTYLHFRYLKFLVKMSSSQGLIARDFSYITYQPTESQDSNPGDEAITEYAEKRDPCLLLNEKKKALGSSSRLYI